MRSVTHIVERDVAASRTAEPPAVLEIVTHRQMWEEPRVLRHVPDAAAMWRDPDAGGRVGEDVRVEPDEAGIGPYQPGDDVQHRRLAGAGRADEAP